MDAHEEDELGRLALIDVGLEARDLYVAVAAREGACPSRARGASVRADDSGVGGALNYEQGSSLIDNYSHSGTLIT